MPPRRDSTQLGTGAPSIIIDGRVCVGCGYSLQGIWSDSVCPECGRSITSHRKRIPRYSDNLINAPMGWLWTFSFGSTMLAVSGFGLIGTLIALAVAPSEMVGFAALLFSVGWLAAAFITTKPRPVTKATTVPPHKEWAALRWVSRLTQVCWVLMCVAILAAFEVGKQGAGFAGTVQFLIYFAVTMFIVAGLGAIPFCIILSNLAFWAEDAGLGQHLRGCAWTIGLAGVATMLSYLQARSGLGSVGVIAVLLAAMLGACMYFPVIYALYCLALLQNMARWAVKNHVTAEAKDLRLKEKAARAALMPGVSTSKTMEPGPIPLAEDSRMV